MNRIVYCIALSLVTINAVGQSPQINVERPAFGYEVLKAVPEGVSRAGDRAIISQFLADKESARSVFVGRAHGSCPALVRGQITVMEFAIRLDEEVEKMNRATSSAYEEMNRRLSAEGRTALQKAFGTVTWMSADTKAAAVAETSPATAESTFLRVCADAGWTESAADSSGRE